MTERSIADHWAQGDVYGRIVGALRDAGKALDRLTIEDLAPVDHFHARGWQATIELADRLPVKAGDHILDIGCGVGGPARYLARRFHCTVTGVDITRPFVEAGNKLTALLGMQDVVRIELADGQSLPYDDEVFEGAYAQHVTMNVADRALFFAEAYRVVRPGGFFAITEHGLGPTSNPHYPLPWSEDGHGAYLVPPAETRSRLEAAGFQHVVIEDTGAKYLESYKRALELASQGALPPLGIHLLIGASAPEKMRNAARNIEEGRTRPIQMVCRKVTKTD